MCLVLARFNVLNAWISGKYIQHVIRCTVGVQCYRPLLYVAVKRFATQSQTNAHSVNVLVHSFPGDVRSPEIKYCYTSRLVLLFGITFIYQRSVNLLLAVINC